MRNSFLFVFFLPFIMMAQESTPFIIQKAAERLSQNELLNQVNSFSYESYENFKITGDPEALTGPGYKKTELRKTLKKTQVLFSERTILHVYDSIKGYKEVVTAAQMPGFEKPVYPVYTIIFQSQFLNQKDYIILDQRFKNPLHSSRTQFYDYQIEKDSVIENRTVYKVNFKPQPLAEIPNLLEGTVYIDAVNYDVVLFEIDTPGELNIETLHSFTYNTKAGVWVPLKRSLYVKKQKTKKELELFGGRLEVGNESPSENQTGQDLYMILEVDYFNYELNIPVDFGKKGILTEIPDEAIGRPESYWDEYRDSKEAYTTTQLAQFTNLDSVVTATKINRKLETLDKFKVGYYPVGFFDIDLKYLVKYNDYEAFRLGVGGQTNEKLSEKWRLSGYVAYGTKDDRFKYKISAGFRIDEEKNTWLNLYKSEDIAEIGAEKFLTDARVYSLFEPRLINIPTFFKYNSVGASLQQRLFPSLISEISLSRKRITQTTFYEFRPRDNSFTNYTLSEVVIGARYSPVSTFMLTPSGYQEITRGYPILSAQYTQGIKGLYGSNFNYGKLSAKAVYFQPWKDNSFTELQVEGHYGRGDIPLTHLYHAYPNSPTKDELLQRFSVAGRRSFETMYFNEFFSDRLITAQVKHRFPALNIASFLKPEVAFITRAALGSMNNTEEHIGIGFDTLEHGYFESGVELNKLLFGFGLSFSYRYGAYHLPDIEDNLALKFTFYLEL
ncbi:DUF5686 family protein [Nonlabens tegetincola]|uniref:DUF5686 family protein n=1 Tax=Nonlabens tegetincola TaxID=323273 RepID=UPI0030C86EB7